MLRDTGVFPEHWQRMGISRNESQLKQQIGTFWEQK